MNIHEYQAKAVLREFGLPVPRGFVAFSVEEAVRAATDLATPVVVVKAQIHAGGRGKAGGVKIVKSRDEAGREAGRLLGSILVTRQTGPQGKQVNRLYVEEGTAIDREFYLSLLVDRGRSRVAWWYRRPVGWTSRKWPHASGADLHDIDRSRDRRVPLSRTSGVARRSGWTAHCRSRGPLLTHCIPHSARRT